MLDKVDFPLTNTQISDFFLEQEYTDYFRVQQVLNDLADSGLIRTESTHSNTQYYICLLYTSLLQDHAKQRLTSSHTFLSSIRSCSYQSAIFLYALNRIGNCV